MNSIAKACSRISRPVGGAQLDLDQHHEADGIDVGVIAIFFDKHG
jgi:hypothetical protein